MSGLYKYIKPLLEKRKEKSKKEVSTIVFQPTNYSSDLTDEQWNIIESFFPYGNQSLHHKRSLVNAVLYIKQTGCQWEQLPNDFPTHNTVWSFFRRTKEKGLWEKINDELVKMTRESNGKEASPTYGIIDSQSAKTKYASNERGIDGGKKIKGRKRHIVVDTMGNLLSVKVHAANIHDTKSGILAFQIAMGKYPTIKGGSADQGYRKTFVEEVKKKYGIDIEISKRIKDKFVIVEKRWVVERTISWFNNSRRLSKDYEYTTSSEEAFVMISHIHTLLKRLSFS